MKAEGSVVEAAAAGKPPLATAAAPVIIDEEGIQKFIENELKNPSLFTTPPQKNIVDAPLDKATAEVMAAVEDDFASISSFGPFWQKWKRLNPKGSKARREYTDLNSDAERKKFRASFAERAYNKVRVEKSHSRSWQEIDASLGEYGSFSFVAFEQQPSEADRAAALEHCKKCCQLQGRWIKWNSMTERYDFLYLRRQHQEKMTEMWTMFEKERCAWTKQARNDAEHETAKEAKSGEK